MQEWFELWQWFSTGIVGYAFSSQKGADFATAVVRKFGGQLAEATLDKVKYFLKTKKTEVEKYLDKVIKDIGKQVASEHNLRSWLP